MKKFILILIVLSFCQYLFSQEHFPKGCYMNWEEIISKSPVNSKNLIIEKRTTSDKFMVGRNDYKLISPDKSVSKKIIKSELLAYSDGDTLYLNCAKYKLQSWFTKIICDGKYFVFWAGMPNDKSLINNETALSYLFGAVGGISAAVSNANTRILYAVDSENDKLFIVNDDLIRDLLKEYPKILGQFNKWAAKSDFYSQIYYLNYINALYLEKNETKSGS